MELKKAEKAHDIIKEVSELHRIYDSVNSQEKSVVILLREAPNGTLRLPKQIVKKVINERLKELEADLNKL